MWNQVQHQLLFVSQYFIPFLADHFWQIIVKILFDALNPPYNDDFCLMEGGGRIRLKHKVNLKLITYQIMASAF